MRKIKLKVRKNMRENTKVMLSGLLNFIDGIWYTSGGRETHHIYY